MAQQVSADEPVRRLPAEHAQLPLPRASSGALEIPFSSNVRQAVCKQRTKGDQLLIAVISSTWRAVNMVSEVTSQMS